MIKHKKWIGKIFRSKNILISRYKKIRLDKNERITHFEKNFFRKFFLSNQIVKKIKRLEEENRNLKKYITQTKYQNLVSKKKN